MVMKENWFTRALHLRNILVKRIDGKLKYLGKVDNILQDLHYGCNTVRPNKKETRFMSKISPLPRKI